MKITRILLLKIISQWRTSTKLLKRTLEILQDLLVMDTFITVDMYIFIVMAFLGTPLIKNQILRYVVYKPHLLLLLLLLLYTYSFCVCKYKRRVIVRSYLYKKIYFRIYLMAYTRHRPPPHTFNFFYILECHFE